MLHKKQEQEMLPAAMKVDNAAQEGLTHHKRPPQPSVLTAVDVLQVACCPYICTTI